MLSKKLFGMLTGILFLVTSFGAYAQNMTVRGKHNDWLIMWIIMV